MQSITFTCETITPMFLAGADGTTPELRAPSIKGALRFWWRAMNGHLVPKNGDLTELKKRESEIFGGSGKKEGRSKVIIRVLSPFPNISNTPLPICKMGTYSNKYKINILDYLAFGVVQYNKHSPTPNKNVLIRDYIGVGEKFYVKFDIAEAYFDEILQTFAILEQFGGLGTKSHNGFGCFKILNDEELPAVSFDDLVANEKKNYTAFSQFSKIYETTSDFSSWHAALAEIGDIYQNARENVETHHHYDKRQLLTAPIIVGKGANAQKSFLDRHAKPYFLHVTKIEDKQFYGQIISMPYQFLKDHPNYTQQLENQYVRAVDAFDAKIRF